MDMKQDWSHETQLAAEPLSASRARAFVSQHLVNHRLMHLVDPVRLVASELATNAMVHADTPFVVTLSQSPSLTGDSVLLSVQDGSASRLAPTVAHAMDTGGRGLSIVAILSDTWGVTADPGGSKTVWARFPS